jgi:prophage regulatory protein
MDSNFTRLPLMLRLPDVERATGLRRSAIYHRIQLGQFPAPVRISSRCSVWPADEIAGWLAALPRGTLARASITAKRDAATGDAGTPAAAA